MDNNGGKEKGQGKAALAQQQGAKTADMGFKARLIQGWKVIVGDAVVASPADQLLMKIGPDPTANQQPDQAPFGPLQPLPAVYQNTMVGRQLDYKPGHNLNYQPRQEEGTSFVQLRQLADSYDLLRLAIETRKDQLCKLSWGIHYKDKEKDPDDRCKAIEDQLAFPDGEHDWAIWLRMLLEDMFVIDAVTIYPRVNKGGQLLSLDLIDGALISRKVDASGRTPQPPSVAYQQIIKGMPAVDYCRLDLSPKPVAVLGSELLYSPRNQRTWKFYGLSHVEQVIITVNIALRRQLYQLQYYTEGSMPDSLIPCPPEWTADQVAQMQELFDTMLSGNTAERRKARFIPGGQGLTPFDTKSQALKDEYDDWLARVVCYCFSLPPTAFVKQANRATADNAKDAAEEEGNGPAMQYVKSLMDLVLARFFGRDVEFVWGEERDIDPLVQAQIDEIYMAAYVTSPEEVRKDLGKKGPPPEKPLPPVMGEDGLPVPGDKGGEEAGKKPLEVQKAAAPSLTRAKSPKSIDRDRKAIQAGKKALGNTLSSFLVSEAADIADDVVGLYDFAAIAAENTAGLVERIMSQLSLDRWATLIDPTTKVLQDIYQDGTNVAFDQINFAPEEQLTDLMSERAFQYAQDRAAELVGMKNIGTKEDPQWFENPNAEWAITDMTREHLNSLVSDAIENGLSPRELKQNIIDDTAFSPARAEMIARTELAFADVEGNMEAYRTSGVVMGKEWILGSEHEGDDECDLNAEAGVIPIDELFPSGDDTAPSHPNCVCDVLPVLIEEGGD